MAKPIQYCKVINLQLKYINLYLKKLNIQKTKILASSPIISWQVDGETMETVRNFILFIYFF